MFLSFGAECSEAVPGAMTQKVHRCDNLLIIMNGVTPFLVRQKMAPLGWICCSLDVGEEDGVGERTRCPVD